MIQAVLLLANGVSVAREHTEKARELDGKRRFIGAGGATESRSFFDLIGKAKDFFSNKGGVDVSGVDPTIDALREVKDVVSPVGRVFSGIGARAIGLFRGHLKKSRGALGGLGKAGLKRLPLLGALFGGASLAKDWNGLDTAGKDKGLGEVIGTTVSCLSIAPMLPR